jgi:hypothetical protein
VKDPSRVPGRKIPDARKISQEDLLRMEFVTEQAVSPDGTRVAWVRKNQYLDSDLPSHNLFVTHLGNMRTTILNDRLKRSITEVKWSADGKALVFMGNLPGREGSSRNHLRQVDLTWDRGLLCGASIIPHQDGFMALVEDGCYHGLVPGPCAVQRPDHPGPAV